MLRRGRQFDGPPDTVRAEVVRTSNRVEWRGICLGGEACETVEVFPKIEKPWLRELASTQPKRSERPDPVMAGLVDPAAAKKGPHRS